MFHSKEAAFACWSFCAILFVFLPAFALSIAELVVGVKYQYVNECNNGDVVLPVVWLLVDGGMGLFSGVIVALCVAEWLAFTTFAVGLALVPAAGFGFAWSIIGAVMLWRDNLSCSPQELHDMLWASVIIRLVCWFSSCCAGKLRLRIGES